MKKRTSGLLALLLLNVWCLKTNAQASCPFQIVNTRSCDVAMLYEVSDCAPGNPSIICNQNYVLFLLEEVLL
jgi:hypothetical protein